MAEDRLLPDWLLAYLQFTDELESPESFHLWTGLGVISSALRRRVHLEMNYGTIYSNLFMIMVAGSAELRKSTAANFGRNLLLDALTDINIMQDSMTSQGLTKSLNQKRSIMENGVINERQMSDVAIFADEVANLFSYDKLRASTTSRDNKIRLHNLYPTLIGCTDPKNLRTIPAEASDGLIGRLIWIIENKRRGTNSGWMRNPKKILQKKLLREMLMKDLQRISMLAGEMSVDDDAMAHYDTWYHELSTNTDLDQDSKAFYYRCHATALRLAMILSVSINDSLRISLKNMIGAITLIEGQLPANQRVALWKGSSNFEVLRAKYVNYLQTNKGVTTRAILLKHMGVPVDEFDRITGTLAQDGTVRVPDQKVKGQTVIILLDANNAT